MVLGVMVFMVVGRYGIMVLWYSSVVWYLWSIYVIGDAKRKETKRKRGQR